MRNKEKFKDAILSVSRVLQDLYGMMYMRMDNRKDKEAIYDLIYKMSGYVDIISFNKFDYNTRSVIRTIIDLLAAIYIFPGYTGSDDFGCKVSELIEIANIISNFDFLETDTSIYKSMVDNKNTSCNSETVTFTNVWMCSATGLENLFNHIWELGYLSEQCEIISTEYEDGYILNFTVYKNKIEDLADLLITFMEYVYISVTDEYKYGWDFRDIIYTLSSYSIEECQDSKKYKNFKLMQYIHNDIVYGEPNPFSIIKD